MKYLKYCFIASSLLLLSLFLSSCITDTQQKEQNSSLAQETVQPVNKPQTASTPSLPASLPVNYQKAAYVVDQNENEDILITEESRLKVGARITSTRGPQPLWDIIKRLASLKGMNVSWASDVDKNVLVDVDINANDDFYTALDNMLRQVDYFHEMSNNTIVIKYKETRQFQIAMPFTKQTYSSATGGNVLGNSEDNTNINGTIVLDSEGNEFDIWDNIKLNIESIMDIWSFRREASMVEEGTTSAGGGEDGARNYSAGATGQTAATASDEDDSMNASADQRNISGGQGYYLIDKPVGLITVTAPRPVLEKVDTYITTLKKSLYQQISIEAKVIEVALNDSSSLGINWSSVLKNFNVNGTIEFGTNGQVYPRDGDFISKITLDNADFSLFLNALNEQGESRVLSNPRLSVMNGQPALITVGRNVTYIDNIESDLDSDSGVVTFTVNTERVLSGVGMALTATVLGKDEVIMNLVPIISELEEPIEYIDIGTSGAQVGLPIINVREMSTTVKVKDGEMLVIGGLISERKDDNGAFAPGLGDIPGLKYLFGYEEKVHQKRELIILLKPRII
ncbi:MAG: pilus (MSHA type) biogenesis protein MshL [Desulforhopalus sp.]|nr:pilus (MSHA type) biogenesis protein MshL [Desulforhopalus sp.]